MSNFQMEFQPFGALFFSDSDIAIIFVPYVFQYWQNGITAAQSVEQSIMRQCGETYMYLHLLKAI